LQWGLPLIDGLDNARTSRQYFSSPTQKGFESRVRTDIDDILLPLYLQPYQVAQSLFLLHPLQKFCQIFAPPE
jgi:hypothetical protein